MLFTTNIEKLAAQRKRVIDAVNEVFVKKCEISIKNLEEKNIANAEGIVILKNKLRENTSQIELTEKLMKEV